MKLGFRELLFFTVLLGLLAASYFVLLKQNQKMHTLQAEKVHKQRELADLHMATAGIADLNGRIHDLQQSLTFLRGQAARRKKSSTRSSRRFPTLPRITRCKPRRSARSRASALPATASSRSK